ncbi:MAG: hypothetical protein CLLPBCKN_001345 [Chroococcidiopsis cubana SAG 39.79]|uniref:Uncharacterized protein n=1 Tax=Chroococcidiopsis cubana SAG 39.79 TaxID=388085 RepID=A0AB37UCV9_9CYAN|nr:hypothetical protein [Chroococcidiopsis cubana]MDZ4871957.1 hypothetical protein [Chroococcidiopsis cubana SAG 39.79]PSB64928.1 hypothetical protein C7B79_07575 [Chroococcidiopsis cubana CCALA 043]RUT05378.1 hypothetical protein DSM107010_55310 [Chroococcidiopsis cubana SAG 39.79]
MLPLQTIDAHGIPTAELCYDEEPQDTFQISNEITYLSVDPSDTEVGLHLILVVLSNDNNRMHYVDCLCQATDMCRALLEAAQVIYQVFRPADYTIVNFWERQDAPF